ncbi:phosphoribosylanthranilate isomerase [Plebeiibacterium sediminum]|uniref:N-(5'-phosphoribosyl)anthranilate isomerase n=1 Tax=Plebeiibacterium sediminum TaxID=2992112 RepID=A0AAE3M3F4_9BACT|nr:phosphoribosylanthranilate isomerase [Plebeiobacterium sediminum]MCW3786095.1 phosphoribosylanthranilate isomerase [Plebeiobacterium sediminum]
MRERSNIDAIAALQPDYMGFIFYRKSPRYIGEDYSPEIIHHLPDTIKKTGVFVNASEQEIADAVTRYELNAVQLHGSESFELCLMVKQMGVEVIKAFQVDEEFDFSVLMPYTEVCDYYLFDTKTKGFGGSGHKFDWSVLNNYSNNKPIFLSGGITQDDVADVMNLKHLNIYAVDINSRFEIEPALKDVEKVDSFIKELKNYKQ